MSGQESPQRDARRRSASLSSRLLLLTILFVTVSEILIYVPSVASYQQRALEDRMATASVAATALLMTSADVTTGQGVGAAASPAVLPTVESSSGPPPAPPAARPVAGESDLRAAVLAELGAYALAFKQEDMRQLLAMAEVPLPVERTVDLGEMGGFLAIREAFDTLFLGGDRVLRVHTPYRDGRLELVLSEAGLRAQLLGYSSRILLVSFVISTLTALLVYAALRRMFVRPMLRINEALRRFAEAPDDPSRNIVPQPGPAEIEATEARILAMQRQLQETLKQQRRLAELGLAVSKINHDLRNLLASAQLVSDRLTHVPDPTVQRFAPKLIAALDRAIGYCQSVMAYGRAKEPAPQRRLVRLRQLVEEVAAVAGVNSGAEIDWLCDVGEELEIDADPDQLFRALVNLVRNAVEALESLGDGPLVRRLTLSARRTGAVIQMRVADTGPGVPAQAREHLFRPFQGTVKRGGTGLGLAIAAEIIRAHGGSLTLIDEGPGTTFDIEIPDRPIPLDEHVLRRRREAV